MKYLSGVFCSDEVNRDNMRISAEAMAEGIENDFNFAVQSGLPIGLPANYVHDWHRVFGWSATIGFFLEGNVARQVGYVIEPDTQQEMAGISKLRDNFSSIHNEIETKPYVEGLRARAGLTSAESAEYFRCGAPILKRAGIARQLYPEFFDQKSPLVDKHGLTDYRTLLKQTEIMQPGVFFDKKRNLLLFAHPYFRRSLSHRNTLNGYFLGDFDAIANEAPDLTMRLRLDEDIIGFPEELRHAMELEYWRGPPYRDDIAQIPSGVTVHLDNDSLEGIKQTEFWWKNAEKKADRKNEPVRTFEAEEIRAHPSYGISDVNFGCRYVHSEFSEISEVINHFDGAIRNYTMAAFEKRMSVAIDRAGKQSEYTKLFRIDGNLSVSRWKSLCTNYFRGNTLVPEYFIGNTSKADDSQQEALAKKPEGTESVADQKSYPDSLKALVGYTKWPDAPDQPEIRPIVDKGIELNGEMVRYIEMKDCHIGKWLRANMNLDKMNWADFPGGIFNLPRILITGPDLDSRFRFITDALAQAMNADIIDGVLDAVSVAFAWQWKNLLITVSIAGPIGAVHGLLCALPSIVTPSSPSSAWIEALEKAISDRSPKGQPLCNPIRFLPNLDILSLPHPTGPEYQFRMRLPIADGENRSSVA